MPKKKLTVAEIEANPQHYRLLYALKHDKVLEFVIDNFGRNNPFILFFKWFMLMALGLFACYNIFYWWHGSIGLLQVFLYPLLGMLFFFLIVPLHEAIHGIALKMVGAPIVKFKADWKRLAFFAEAPDFVTGKSIFIFIAIAPFILINSSLIIAFPFLDYTWAAVLWGTFLMHSMGCIGDFSLMGYFSEHRRRKLYTFDKAGEKVMYFYEKIDKTTDSLPEKPDVLLLR